MCGAEFLAEIKPFVNLVISHPWENKFVCIGTYINMVQEVCSFISDGPLNVHQVILHQLNSLKLFTSDKRPIDTVDPLWIFQFFNLIFDILSEVHNIT